MRLAALFLALAACRAPDRYHITGVRGSAEYEGTKGLGFDEDNKAIEVGVSGPIWPASNDSGALKDEVRALRAEVVSLAQQHKDSGELPIYEIIGTLVALGAAGYGGNYGYKKLKSRRTA